MPKKKFTAGQVKLAAICGSDLHTYYAHEQVPRVCSRSRPGSKVL